MAGFGGGSEFTLGLQPIVEFGARRRTTLEENLVGTESDLLLRGTRECTNGFFTYWWLLKSGGFAGHAILQ